MPTLGTAVRSSIGWLGHDALWRFDASSGAIETIPLGRGATYCSLNRAASGRFAVADHFDGRRFEVSVGSFSAPSAVHARAVTGEGEDRSVQHVRLRRL